MSCHNPSNIGVLGYCAGAFSLDSESVESEFHWLKRVGRDRRLPAPSSQDWAQFCDQQTSWISHDERLSDTRRARLLSRLETARSGDAPDGATFYALQNLPSRLTYVTDPDTVRATVTKVQFLTDRVAKTGHADENNLREAVLNLRRAEAILTRHSTPDPADLPTDMYSLVEEASEVTEMLDIYLATPTHEEGQASREHLYQAHRWIASALRQLKRI